MKTDVNGCSTCAAGRESFEVYYSNIARRELVQYDYRTPDGELFSTVGPTLDRCRALRDKWLARAV